MPLFYLFIFDRYMWSHSVIIRMCLCNKGYGFNTSHTTGFHDTWAACVKNNQPFTLPATHVFQNKMVAAIVTVTQVTSNNIVVTQYLSHINGGTATTPFGGLHHMGDDVLASHYAVKKSLYVNITKIMFLIPNFLCSFMAYRGSGI